MVHLVCSDGFGGVERYIANLAGALQRDGTQLEVIGGDPALMAGALRESGARWMPGGSVREALRSLRSLDPPDVLNTHMTQADVVGAVYCAAGGGRRVRHVSTRHFAAPRGGQPAVRRVLGVIDRRLAAQVAISAFVADSIRAPSEVIHSGVAPRGLGGERDRTVLVAQRLEPEKHTATAVRAWHAAAARHRGWRLQIAGDGAERGELERLTRALGVADSVDFLGFRSDVDALLARAALVLAPTPREGLGILVLEAMAHGTPVVAAAGGGHLETVGSVRPDLLFPPSDIGAAAAVIDAFTADPARLHLAGGQLHEAQRERFSLAAQAEATRALYERVAG